MGIGRIFKTAIKIAPVAYPIIKKVMKNRKSGNTTKYKTPNSKR